MLISQRGEALECLAPAKLNLFLEIIGRRADGFHELETLMCRVNLYDWLYIDHGPRGCTRFSCEDARWTRSAAVDPVTELPENQDNLVVRAIEALRQHCGVDQGIAVRLVKRIPIAAGLAGGSSDAAAALCAANQFWNLRLPVAELARLAGELGSDIPFFLEPGPAICRGRGERIERVSGLGNLHFVVVHPGAGLSTAAVYRACRPAESPRSSLAFLQAWQRGDALAMSQALHNQLEPAASQLSPVVDRLRNWFSEFDMMGHQLSGSGTSYFGICRSARQARRIASLLRQRQAGSVFALTSCN
jgi:4-diphosphocytidyl-2-C-methyl-D-erythritol kinase